MTFWKQTAPRHRTNQLDGDSIPLLFFTIATNSSAVLYDLLSYNRRNLSYSDKYHNSKAINIR